MVKMVVISILSFVLLFLWLCQAVTAEFIFRNYFEAIDEWLACIRFDFARHAAIGEAWNELASSNSDGSKCPASPEGTALFTSQILKSIFESFQPGMVAVTFSWRIITITVEKWQKQRRTTQGKNIGAVAPMQFQFDSHAYDNPSSCRENDNAQSSASNTHSDGLKSSSALPVKDAMVTRQPSMVQKVWSTLQKGPPMATRPVTAEKIEVLSPPPEASEGPPISTRPPTLVQNNEVEVLSFPSLVATRPPSMDQKVEVEVLSSPSKGPPRRLTECGPPASFALIGSMDLNNEKEVVLAEPKEQSNEATRPLTMVKSINLSCLPEGPPIRIPVISGAHGSSSTYSEHVPGPSSNGLEEKHPSRPWM